MCQMQKKRSYEIMIVALMGKYVPVKSACIATTTSYHASCHNNKYYVFFLSVIVPQCHCQRISSSIRSGQPVCPGDEIVLICKMSDSATLTWTNLDYIGQTDKDLKFVHLNDEGHTLYGATYATTVAKLTRNILYNNIRVLESELRITIRSDVDSTSVGCVHFNGTIDSFTLRLLGISYYYICMAENF